MYAKKQILCAGYVRLSREDGDHEESNSIQNQKALIRDYCGRHPELELVDLYADDGYTGTNYDRPGFTRMMEDAQTGRINCIIVKDLSRLGRNHIETGRYLERIFPSLGLRFIAINDNYDSADENRSNEDIIVPFKNLINDAYCRDISMKVRSHLDVKRKNGLFIGSFAVYGYLKDPDNKNRLVIDEYAAGIVKLIFKKKMEGMSPGRIAGMLDDMGVLPPMEYKRACNINFNSGFRAKEEEKWSVVAVTRILRNETYTGTMVQGKRRKINYKVKKSVPVPQEDWIRVDGTHEAIIPRSMFDRVQELLELDTRTSQYEETVGVFSGFLRCGDCGQNMVKRSTVRNGKKYIYYHCSTYGRNKSECSSHLISEVKLTDAVLSAIRAQVELLVDADRLIREAGELPAQSFSVRGLNRQIAALDAEIEKISNRKEHLYKDMTDGLISREEFTDIAERFRREIRENEQKKEELERRQQRLMENDNQKQPWLEEFCQYRNIKSLNRGIMVALVDRIIVYGKDNIEIRFRYGDEMKEFLAYTGQTKEAGALDEGRAAV